VSMADAGGVTPAAPEEPRHAVHGCLGLAFAHRNGHTALVRQVGRSPLHVQGILHGVGPGAEVVVLNVAGNVLGGDVLDLEVAAGCDTHVQLRTVGATRVHQGSTGVAARSQVTLRVESGALVEYVPGELIPHTAAWLEQETTVHLAPGGHAIVAEVVAPGRFHHGEAFTYRRLALRLRALYAGLPVVCDRLILEPATWSFGRRAVVGPFTHVATLYALGPRADGELGAELHRLVADRGLHGSATAGERAAVIVRVLGHSAYALAGGLCAAAAHCRQRFQASGFLRP
jgi:urease accessory protein